MRRCVWPECAGADPPRDGDRPLYVARNGGSCVEVGLALLPLVRQLCREWQAGGGDVAVWVYGGLHPGCWLVAVLREAPSGQPLVTWL